MKLIRLLLCTVVALSALAGPAARPAAANVFCPVSIGALEDLGPLGRGSTYGVLLDFEPGNTASVRLRVDSQTTRYAIDFNDVEALGDVPLGVKRYFALPPGQTVVQAWIESTGENAAGRLPCPIADPYDVNAPAGASERADGIHERNRQALLDSFSNRTFVSQPVPFGAVERRTCAVPYAPARTLIEAPPIYPTEARAVHAVGTAVVRVDIDENGVVVGAAVIRTSGYAPLDRAARETALKSTFRTETFACRPIASSYALTVVFNG